MSAEIDFAAPEFLGAPRGMAKYEHLRAAIATAIESGQFNPGAKLPPELELAAQTKLSLGTVQRALRELVMQGYLVRHPGTGTFIADRRRRLEEPLHCRFWDEEQKTLLPVYTRLLQRQRVDGEGPWSSVLGRDHSILRLDRTIDIDGRFVVASRLYVRANRFPGLDKMPKHKFAGVNIKKLLYTQFAVEVAHVEQRVRIETPNQDIIRWLGLPAKTTVIRLEGIAYDSARTAIYFQELWVPPTHYPLVMHVTP